MFFLPANITINAMKLNNVDHLGVVSLSSTTIQNRNVSAKKNQGFGQQFADGVVKAFNVTSTIDNEILDGNSHKTTI